MRSCPRKVSMNLVTKSNHVTRLPPEVGNCAPLTSACRSTESLSATRRQGHSVENSLHWILRQRKSRWARATFCCFQEMRCQGWWSRRQRWLEKASPRGVTQTRSGNKNKRAKSRVDWHSPTSCRLVLTTMTANIYVPDPRLNTSQILIPVYHMANT